MSRRITRRSVLAALLLLGAALHGLDEIPRTEIGPWTDPPAAAHSESKETDAGNTLEPGPDGVLGCQQRSLTVPSGAPPRLTCAEARGLIAEVHSRFAGPNDELRVREFAGLVGAWLDPHGLWSAAPDAWVARVLEQRGAALLEELRRDPRSGDSCFEALRAGAELERWITELSNTFDRAARGARKVDAARGFRLAAETMFQDDPVTRPARVLARRLGEHLAGFVAGYPELAEGTLEHARARYFPELSAEAWAEAVLAAAVRAYVPLLDPHGAWAPFDEEWSLYAADPGFDAGPRLWGEISRTAIGVRVLSDALPPLSNGDLVLAVDGTTTLGMPLEQLEQLGRLEPEEGTLRHVLVLRSAEPQAQSLWVDVGASPDAGAAFGRLEKERLAFGAGSVLVARIPDVPESLGESLGRMLADERDERLLGVVLDLRGNGGGSTEAAADVLGLFLPGRPLFPLSARGRLVEVMRAGEPDPKQRWSGPVAAIVDGHTASAAEMIAGAMAAYGRGPLLGRRTFGKGCIQEYADDHLGRGVLRITTLLYALPDGSAVQKAGLIPDFSLPVHKARDREADVSGALPGYWGPDVREPLPENSPEWPSHAGNLGTTKDPVLAAALRRLGTSPSVLRPLPARRSNLRASTATATLRP